VYEHKMCTNWASRIPGLGTCGYFRTAAQRRKVRFSLLWTHRHKYREGRVGRPWNREDSRGLTPVGQVQWKILVTQKTPGPQGFLRTGVNRIKKVSQGVKLRVRCTMSGNHHRPISWGCVRDWCVLVDCLLLKPI
jgi:hypothetical protein